MDAVFIKLLNMSIAASWLILAVILLRVLLWHSPKWIRCILWGIVAVRLVCPISIESRFSLIPNAEPVDPAVVWYSPTPTIDSGVEVIDQAVNPVISESFAPTPGASVNPLAVWMYLAGIVWAIGLVVLLGYGLFSYVRLHRVVSEAVLLRDNIWVGDSVGSPFILGVIRPRIYLSSGMEESQMSCILAHEQAHLKRRDHWWKLLGYLLLSVYWFNPLSWAAYALLCRDIELACDEKVVRGWEEAEKKQYSRTLVSCSMQRKRVMACPLAFGEVGVKQRVKAVLSYRKPAFWIVLIAIVACLVTAVCFLTNSPRPYQVRVTIPAKGTGNFYYSDEEICPKGRTLTLYAGEGMGDGEVVLLPVEWQEENAYEPTYITRGMPVKMQVEKGAWFKIGVNTRNPSEESKNVYITAENVDVRIASTVSNEGVQETGKEGLTDASEAGAQETEGDRAPSAETTELTTDSSLGPDSSEVAYIVITNGNTGDEMTFGQASPAFHDLLQLYGQLDFTAETEENTRVGYHCVMRLKDADGVILHTVTPYKDGFSMDGLFYLYNGMMGLDQPSVNLMNAMDALFYPPSEDQIIARVLGRTAVGWSNSMNFDSDADILVKMAADSTGEYEVYGIISKEMGAYGLVLNDIIDGDDNHSYVYTPWVYTGVPQDKPKLEWSEDGKVLWFSYIAAEENGEYVWRRCIVDCGYETGHMELLGKER
ncbi:MAG: M56 family metallopeptidase [Acetatifactor sp.]|nr:M56 family metallopeptidase [Acetatifactor sp.]